MRLRYRDSVLALAVLANFGQFGARLVVSPLVRTLGTEFAVTKADLGLVLTGMWAAFALCNYPSGVLADAYGERRVVVLALGVTGLCSLAISLAPSFLVFGVLALALGGGAGLYFSVGTALLSRLYEDTGGAFGLHSSGAPIAGVVVPPTTVAIASRFGWPAAFRAAGTFALLVAGVLAWRVRPTDPREPGLRLRDRFSLDVYRSLVGRRDVAFTLLLATLGMYAFQSFTSFFPTFLVEYRSLGDATASTAFAAAFVLSAVGLPVLGRLSDRVGRDPAMAAAFTTTAAGLVLLLVVPGVTGLVAGVGVVGVGISWGGVLQSRFMDIFPADSQGTGFGLSRTVFVFLGSVGNAVTGTLAETAGWLVAVGVIAGVLLVAVAALAGNRALGLGL